MKRIAYISVLMAGLITSCVDNHILPAESGEGAGQGIAFTGSVASSQWATRADKTIVNKGETHLLPTATSHQRVGIFGAYTGQNKWADLVTLSKKANPTGEETKTLNTYYSASQMYNVPATIEEYANGSNSLTYAPLRFWPNNVLTTPATGHEYMTFWAYYPYNPTSSMGTYGISMTDAEMGAGKGMGRVKFTMHPDASQQNDFLISAPVVDCNRDKYPLIRTDGTPAPYDDTPTYAPKPVPFRFYHMLAQVRFYVFIRGDDKMVYQKDGEGNDLMADADWFDSWATNGTIMDAYGNVYTKKGDNEVEQTTRKAGLTDEQIETYHCGNLTKAGFLALNLKVPDESQCVRWDRSEPAIWDLNHARRRANITYTMELNNIKTSATFFPNYNSEGRATIDVEEAHSLGSATINTYLMNPYWFTFRNGQRERLNDNYMFGYYEDTPAAKAIDATEGSAALSGYDDYDGMNWTGLTDPLCYLTHKTTDQKEALEGIGEDSWIDNSDHSKGHKHYNFAPGNILLVVPQTLSDDDVPHVVITAHGKTKQGTDAAIDNTARVTVNLLKMGISWESGYIYCYAFLDDLKPGDDKVRGPESITVLFNTDWYPDQW
ncbi:MAG: fimbrillin family protein [Bacteroidaceae bacterium]|nr:fimbrillin family protein [Bacteroidaceae bacterium]